MRAVAVALAFAALAVVATACGGSEDSAGPPTTTPTTETSAAAPNREPAPELAGTTLDGDAIALGDFRGRPLMINVWSSW